MPNNNSFFLLGPRQTGKTTLIKSWLPPKSWTIDLLEHDTFLRFAREPWRFREETIAKINSGIANIFIDEIQKLPQLLDEVHGLIENTRAHFIMTGSSARKLRRGGANTLAGRALTRQLHPLTINELGNNFDLDRVLRFGSLPSVVTRSDDEARDLLQSYTQTYLREEIQAEALVRNLGGFSRFLDIAAAQSGDLLNYSSVARDAGLAVRTVQEYYQILEDTLLGFRLEPYRRSPRARMVGHPRLYLFDLGVLNALCRRLTAPVDPALRGRLFEHLIVLETMRQLDYAGSEARLFFWRTNHGAEVDLLVEKHGAIILAVEIKSKKVVAGADIGGLRSFRDHHPGVPCVVASLVPQPFMIDGIKIAPYLDYLSMVSEIK